MRNQGSGSLKRLSELQMGHFKVILDQYVTSKLELWTYPIFYDFFILLLIFERFLDRLKWF